MKYDKGNVLYIGDPHEPFGLNKYLPFCASIREKYKCATVACVGDMIDHHGCSKYDIDPDGYSTGNEVKLTIKKLKKWSKIFPKMKICIGNHDARISRKCKSSGISSHVLKHLNDIYNTPNTWEWAFNHTINKVLMQHGTGKSGKNAALAWANANRMSTVIGHTHAFASILFSASYKDLIFGMNVGCGINRKLYAYDYGQDFAAKPVISCGVVLENGRVPIVETMKL